MKENIICGCNNITLQDLEDGITNGLTEFAEFQEKTGIGTGCPSCLTKNELLFEKILQEYRLSLLEKILVL